MRVLVCGGRDYRNYETVYEWIRDQVDFGGCVTVIHGGCSGADNVADYVAGELGLDIEVYPADWKRHGKAAGPIRNQQMLDDGKPDIVLAFPGGRGTADMVRRAKAAGVRVVEVEG